MARLHREYADPFFRARLRANQRERLEVEQARAHGLPRSILLGRPWPQPGEPLFTAEDTDWVIALAEEERDTCTKCGLPKAWCRGGKDRPFTDYDVVEETCQASLRLAHFTAGDSWKGRHEATRQATVLAAKFREGKAPDIDAGLELHSYDEAGDDQ